MNLTVFKYAFRRGLNIVSLVANLGLPIVLILFARGIFDDASLGFLLIALMIMVGSFYMAKSIQEDKMTGVLMRILCGPVSMRSYLVQNFFASMIPAMLQAIIVCVLGVIIHGWQIEFAALLALSYSMLSASTIGMSFAWSCVFKNKESSSAAFIALLTFATFLGGFLIGLSSLPDILYYLGAILPGQWAVRSINELIAHGATGTYWLAILAMALFTIMFLLYGGKRRLV
ncbi:MAG: ABC transporter permease [Defluviitaleaceae bacterium]|nr:ABC transporter permease [Defluviitaleaceae bacterium]